MEVENPGERECMCREKRLNKAWENQPKCVKIPYETWSTTSCFNQPINESLEHCDSAYVGNLITCDYLYFSSSCLRRVSENAPHWQAVVICVWI